MYKYFYCVEYICRFDYSLTGSDVVCIESLQKDFENTFFEEVAVEFLRSHNASNYIGSYRIRSISFLYSLAPGEVVPF